MNRRSLLKAAIAMLGLPLAKLLPAKAGPITYTYTYTYTDAKCRVSIPTPIQGGYMLEEPDDD
ncbi:MAG: hypothetical protein PHU85_10660 [Phycisphaerae bacterium]|nr:hypothetical protein [Phycisphaerae bacterium]